MDKATKADKIEVNLIDVSKIKPNPEQPRKIFDLEALKELAESIKKNGLVQPIVVQKLKEDEYVIVAGERRWRATKLAGIKYIPAIVKEYSKETAIAESLAENLHRTDLSLHELGSFLKKIQNTLSQRDLSEKYGISKSTIQAALEYCELSHEVRDARGKVSEYNVLEITKRIPDKTTAVALLKKANKENWKRQEIRSVAHTIVKATPETKKALFSDKINVEQAEKIEMIRSPRAKQIALDATIKHNTLANITPELMKDFDPALAEKIKAKFDSTQKKLFTQLKDAGVNITKAVANLNNTNTMLSELKPQPIELTLTDKELVTTGQQLTRILSKIQEFETYVHTFKTLSDDLCERFKKRQTLLRK